MLSHLKYSISEFPKGSINRREKHYKGKIYSYHYLKYREGNKVISKHIPNSELKDFQKKIEMRKKYEKEIKSYRMKIAYLNEILKLGKNHGHGTIFKK